jgi:D-3-phosphoglycerate dehydrogenase
MILGDHDVNISAMHLARRAPREEAKMLLALDDAVPEDAVAAIRADPEVLDLWLIHLSTSA